MKMPNVVGKTVFQAQFKLSALVRIVYVDHKSNDPVIRASNWKICKQEPAPGTKGVKRVVLTVIRNGETCKVSH
ncbi:PASTA domain-containing protein [Kutzneria sp. 744]|uniref:PASTA domain-containing protein n=1 Tax=Kutzneria sp. (strain 744) TaxID=345341 RepID=UPI0003EEE0DE|nr:PASTA domain-containing protein [Kutzneria sp. 744]EWM09803.1 hypothetical protein KUTG_00107 [Kutzneria sp. 744]